jgi:hypothetical protein
MMPRGTEALHAAALFCVVRPLIVSPRTCNASGNLDIRIAQPTLPEAVPFGYAGSIIFPKRCHR